MDEAARFPRALCIGVDPVAAQMADWARRATRGAIPNALFVQASVESLPAELLGLADQITINFPWGSLLRALAEPDLTLLASIASLGRPGASLSALINMTAFDVPDYCRRHDLPIAPVFSDFVATRSLYHRAGLDTVDIEPNVGALPYRTSWGQRLTKGARRRVLKLSAEVVPIPRA